MAFIWIALKIAAPRERAIEHLGYPGRDGKEFWLLKFRTHASRAGWKSWPGRAVSAVGLDELPQLANVIRGDMSLVGPRPVSETDYELLDEWQRMRDQVLPGVTGLWQISARHDSSVAPMVLLDLYYIQRWSLALDIEILLKTLGAALRNRRATLSLEAPSATGRRPRFTERRSPFGEHALQTLAAYGGLDFDSAVSLARLNGGNASEMLDWLHRLERKRWIDLFDNGDGQRFALNSRGVSVLAEDRRRGRAD
jgi:hypothetical protein